MLEQALNLDSVRSLKAELFNGLLRTDSFEASQRGLQAFSAGSVSYNNRPLKMALGISKRGASGEYSLALRLQFEYEGMSQILERIADVARGEIDFRFIGPVVALSSSPLPVRRQVQHRPLRMGTSIGHTRITAGTLGAFVRDRETGQALILSNNHVLAVEDTALLMDPIVQPGPFDGGSDPGDTVAGFFRSHPLTTNGNLVDAAVAIINPNQRFRPRTFPGRERFSGRLSPAIDIGDRVSKVGRTTGTTRGVVTAIELDAVAVTYSQGPLTFDGQFEIEGTESSTFSERGDSGALILDAESQAAGLLFAGGSSGGSNGMGLTYANPIEPVLDLLGIDLI